MKLALTKMQVMSTAVSLTFVAAFAWYAIVVLNNDAPATLPAVEQVKLPNTVEELPGRVPEAPSRGVSVPAGEASVRRAGQLTVTRIDVAAPLMVVGRADEQLFQKALEDGVVHYPGTASPGQPGNMYVFGHSSDYRYRHGSYKTVFARLPELQAGDRIVVTDATNTSFTYKVTGGAVVAAGAMQYLSQDTGGKSLLTLQTSYPIGTALKRYVVISELEPNANYNTPAAR